MRVLVACEFSGTVRDAFARRGHCAHSADLLPTERDGKCDVCGGLLHFYGDISYGQGPADCRSWIWDIVIGHPPCTYLANSGARWWPQRREEQYRAIQFVRWMAGPAWCGSPRIAIENPSGILSTAWRKPDQTIQPWQFGHAEIKTTCLWLKGLPPLIPTSIVRTERRQKCWKMPPGENRARERSRTYSGIAEAMAEQWGNPECDVLQSKLEF